MYLDELIIASYCVVDDVLARLDLRIRRAGPAPALSDAEVITIELVGEYLGLIEDKQLWSFFRGQYAHFFPRLRHLHRTTFVRQAANLWRVKERVWRAVLDRITFERTFAMVDSLPVPVCRFARAYRCRPFRPAAAYGRDIGARQLFFGFRLHARVCWPGVVTEVVLAPANVSDSEAAIHLTAASSGTLLADRAYDRYQLHEALSHRPVRFIVQSYSKLHDPRPRLSYVISRIRYRIECIFAQLSGRYHVKQSSARDLWHLSNRIIRKVLSHTLMVLLNQQEGRRPSIRLAGLAP